MKTISPQETIIQAIKASFWSSFGKGYQGAIL